ncbi:MAG TPA: DUF2071 domain-containing protein [Chloroflexia bacterium]|jgi:hypothetical protein
MDNDQLPDRAASPLRRGPWIVRQRWHNLLFAHWPVDAAQLRAAVPRQLELDRFNGEVWLGLVVFRLSGIKLRGTPEIKAVASFPEANVRTYVTYQGQPGVYFMSLDADNPLAIAIARPWFGLNYWNAEIRYTRNSEGFHFKSRRIERGLPEARLDVTYAPADDVPGEPLSPYRNYSAQLREWLTERYCYYVVRRNQVHRCDTEHEPWQLQPARVTFREESLALSHGVILPRTDPLVHYTRYMEAHIWPVRRVEKRPCLGGLALRSLRGQPAR